MIPSKIAIPSAVRASNRDRLSRFRRFRADRSGRDAGTSTGRPTRSATPERVGTEWHRPSGRLVASAWTQAQGWLRRRSTDPWAANLPWSTFLDDQSYGKPPRSTLYTLLRQALQEKCRVTAAV